MRTSADHFFGFRHFHLNSAERLLQSRGRPRRVRCLLIREGENSWRIGSIDLDFLTWIGDAGSDGACVLLESISNETIDSIMAMWKL
jgi:hypothetical protein